jgi:hypothetical protein
MALAYSLASRTFLHRPHQQQNRACGNAGFQITGDSAERVHGQQDCHGRAKCQLTRENTTFRNRSQKPLSAYCTATRKPIEYLCRRERHKPDASVTGHRDKNRLLDFPTVREEVSRPLKGTKGPLRNERPFLLRRVNQPRAVLPSCSPVPERTGQVCDRLTAGCLLN